MRGAVGIVYEIGIRLYGALLALASVWHSKARLWVRGRRCWAERLGEQMDALRGYRVVWFHCASLGEFEQGRHVMERFMALHPDWRLVLTFFSPSGYQVRHGYALASVVCYLPLDTRRNAERFLDLVRPSMAFFVKYEYWYNVLHGLSRRGVPTFLISALFRREQAFFGFLGRLYRRWLSFFTVLFVQSEGSVSLLAAYGINHAVLAGDTRFDRVCDAVKHAESLPWLDRFVGDDFLIVLGSTWPKDEEIALRLACRLPVGWKLALVPHEIDITRLERWGHGVGGAISRYSQGVGAGRILVVDTVGLLLSVYSRADMAYVGGGFGSGIHNTLEPAAYGIPVVFGPNHGAFHEALGLLRAGAAVAVESVEHGVEVCLELMVDSRRRTEMGERARRFVWGGLGATEVILDRVEDYT